MKHTEFAARAREIAQNRRTLYALGGFGAPLTAKNKNRYTTNNAYNRAAARVRKVNAAPADTFVFDCVGLIKGLLWGWEGDPAATYGGAVYQSGGVPDSGADATFRACTDKSGDFSSLTAGEMLWMSGHCGIYVGDGLAAEATPKWADGVQLTAVGNLGAKPGYPTRTWTSHGRLTAVEYPAPEPEPVAAPGISEPAVSPAEPALPALPALSAVGSRVRLKPDAKVWGRTYGFSAWVYRTPLWLRELNGFRAVVSTQPTGAVTGAVDVRDLTPES